MTSNKGSDYWNHNLDGLPRYWLNPLNEQIYERTGENQYKDPIMKSLTTGDTITISNRALNRTWYPRYLVNGQWKKYEN